MGCLTCVFVMLRLISIALLYGGKDVDQPFGLSGFLDALLNLVIFKGSPQLTDEFEFNTVFICDVLYVCMGLSCKRSRELWKIKKRILLMFR